MTLKIALAASVAIAALFAASGTMADEVNRRIDIKKISTKLVADPADVAQPDLEEATVKPKFRLRADPEDTVVAEEEEEEFTPLPKKKRVADVEPDFDEEVIVPNKKRVKVADEPVQVVKPKKKVVEIADEDFDEFDDEEDFEEELVVPKKKKKVAEIDEEPVHIIKPVKKKKVVSYDYEDEVEVKWSKAKTYNDDYDFEYDYVSDDYAAGCHDDKPAKRISYGKSYKKSYSKSRYSY